MTFPFPIVLKRNYSYTTWNSADKDSVLTLSGNNLIATHTGGVSGGNVRSVKSNSSGKWYYEVTWTTKTSDPDDFSWGVGSSGMSLSTNFVGSHAASWGAIHDHATTAVYKRNNSSSTALTSTYTAASGDVYMCAWDADAGKLWFGRNGTWFDSGNPAAGTNNQFSSVTGTLFIMAGSIRLNDVFTLNPGPTFTYTVPSGFSGWIA